ncbi:MAG TPA: hypothetical protein PLC81_09965 [Bacteroidales bacterium]|nr:hypothetical protein [Bacteroidales bacterium]
MDKFQWLNEMNRRFNLLQDCQKRMVEIAMATQDADFLMAVKTAVKHEIADLDLIVSFIDRIVVTPQKPARTKQISKKHKDE